LELEDLPSLEPTLHLKYWGWKMSFLSGRLIFRSYVSFMEGKIGNEESFTCEVSLEYSSQGSNNKSRKFDGHIFGHPWYVPIPGLNLP